MPPPSSAFGRVRRFSRALLAVILVTAGGVAPAQGLLPMGDDATAFDLAPPSSHPLAGAPVPAPDGGTTRLATRLAATDDTDGTAASDEQGWEPGRFRFDADGLAFADETPSEGDAGVDPAQYVEESFRNPHPQGAIGARVDREVDARLAGIPRPRYIPATDIAPPRGLLLYTEDPRSGEFPFALSVGGFLQLRWLEFARGATNWTNSAGNQLPISNIDAFSLNRYLLMFSGHAVDERLIYAFALFGTSNSGINTGVAPIGMAGWKFGPEATIGAGVTIVPGTREFVDGSPWTIGVDRSMANTFFRPGYSPGVAAIGALADGTLHYQAGVWNSIDAGGANVLLRRGTSMAWAGNLWWEPLGPFGLGFSDMEHHEDAVVRVGTSGVFAPNMRALPVPGFNPENTIIRLSDGTPLASNDALGPGTVVDAFTYRLATIDAGWKWRGVSANAEYTFRFLDSFKGTGPFSRTGMLDHGGAGYLGWCFIPRTWEVYARSSVVTGPFGTGQEYGGGINRYVNRSRQGRLTLEAIHMLRNPAQNILYPYRAGYTGTAIQTQFVVAF